MTASIKACVAAEREVIVLFDPPFVPFKNGGLPRTDSTSSFLHTFTII
jgi:hypothetical protein